jgi:hypothetical protein
MQRKHHQQGKTKEGKEDIDAKDLLIESRLLVSDSWLSKRVHDAGFPEESLLPRRTEAIECPLERIEFQPRFTQLPCGRQALIVGEVFRCLFYQCPGVS